MMHPYLSQNTKPTDTLVEIKLDGRRKTSMVTEQSLEHREKDEQMTFYSSVNDL